MLTLLQMKTKNMSKSKAGVMDKRIFALFWDTEPGCQVCVSMLMI